MSVSLRSDPSGTSAAVQVNGVDKLVLNADGSLVATAAPALDDNSLKLATTSYVQNELGGIYSSKNVIINGSMRTAQRGPNVQVTGSQTLFGGPDRYAATNSGAGGSFNQLSSTITVAGVPKVSVTQQVVSVLTDLSSLNYWGGVCQFIEGQNARCLLGNPGVLSFWFHASVAGNYSVSISDGGGQNSYVTYFGVAANTPTKIVVKIPTFPTTLNIPLNANTGLAVRIGAQNNGTYSTNTINTWQAGNFVCYGGKTTWGLTANAFISVAELQLEVGTQATNFEWENISVELMKCQRYYQTRHVTQIGYQQAGIGMFNSLNHPVVMRGTPTVATFNITTNNITYTGAGIASDAAQYSLTSAAVVTGWWQFVCDAQFSAEL